jgi:CubicO group peptidase (beta-lactamase class C family)
MRRRLGWGHLVVFAAIVTGSVRAQNATDKPRDGNPSSPTATHRSARAGEPRLGDPQPFPEAKSTAPPKTDDELATAINRLAVELAAAGRFSGSVLVVVDGKPLVDNAWGEADRENHLPNKPETSFDIGSIGKLFTQIAILQLMEAGKMALDEPFGKYLTNYPNRDIAAKVTVRQLLLHTSGMGDIFDRAAPENDFSSMHQLNDFLPLFAHKPVEFAPGTQTHYSNAGYIVLGLVVEAVSGEDYYKYVEEHVLKPAGMRRSGFFDRSHLPPTVAHSYDDGSDVTRVHPVRGSSAGGLQASAGDLWRLVQAIDGGRLVKSESVKALRGLIPHPPTALRIDESKLRGYGIAGGAPGVSAQLAIDPTGRYTRIILCNVSPPMAMSMAATINEWIKQMPK